MLRGGTKAGVAGGLPGRPGSLTNQVGFLVEVTFGKGDLWALGYYQQLRHVGPLERKTPLDGEKVEFNFIFYYAHGGKGNGKCVCCRHMNTERNSGCGFITFTYIKVNVLILFTIGGRKLSRAEDLLRWKLHWNFQFHSVFTTMQLSDKNLHLTDLFQSLIFKKAIWKIGAKINSTFLNNITVFNVHFMLL